MQLLYSLVRYIVDFGGQEKYILNELHAISCVDVQLILKKTWWKSPEEAESLQPIG